MHEDSIVLFLKPVCIFGPLGPKAYVDRASYSILTRISSILLFSLSSLKFRGFWHNM